MRNGLIKFATYIQMIEECAYFLWLNGSNDTNKNWIDAERYINEQLKR